jgi:hypothetical protein
MPPQLNTELIFDRALQAALRSNRERGQDLSADFLIAKAVTKQVADDILITVLDHHPGAGDLLAWRREFRDYPTERAT